jgi:flagellar basal-body rod modification protein FlgD
MSEINVGQATGLGSSTGLGTSASTANLGKDDFLKLLSVQLQYQDPLKPMENTEFIAQMAQFSTLEGITNMNESLAGMSDQVLSMNNLSTTDLIGRNIKVYGDKVDLVAGESPQIDYVLYKAASKVEISILDASGTIVKTINTGSKEAGANTFVWDGTDSIGNPRAAGTYSVSINATTKEGTQVTARAITNNLVDGVTYENGVPYLMVQGSTVSLNDILEVWGK